MKKVLNIFLVLILGLTLVGCQESKKEEEPANVGDNTGEEENLNFETITFSSTDGLEITADAYIVDETAPIIVMFHRANWSRGEYRYTAPRLNDLGFNVLAVDQRSGSEIGGVKNNTAKLAIEQGLGTEFADAIPDAKAAVDYVINEMGYDEVLTWGSSYSTVLAVTTAIENPEQVKGIITYSPGGYFKYEGENLDYYLKDLDIPIYITGSKGEKIVSYDVYTDIEGDKKVFFEDEEVVGKHGSICLWPSTKGFEKYWASLEDFLANYN